MKVLDKLRWRQLFRKGKRAGKRLGGKTEAEIAEQFTDERRKYEPWRKKV